MHNYHLSISDGLVYWQLLVDLSQVQFLKNFHPSTCGEDMAHDGSQIHMVLEGFVNSALVVLTDADGPIRPLV